MIATPLKSELQTHTLDLNLNLSQFVFPGEICWGNQRDFFPLFAWNILMTKFISGGKMHDNIKMNATNYD